MRRDDGFTLVELMIALALFAILSSLALPSFMTQRREAVLKDAVSMIRGDLELARSQAIRENAPAAVLLREDGYSIFIDNGSGGGIAENWVRDGGEKQICNRSLPKQVKIDLDQITFDNKRTRFNGRGYLINHGVLVVTGTHGRSIRMDMTNRFGRIRVD